jgi:hypothetical protein
MEITTIEISNATEENANKSTFDLSLNFFQSQCCCPSLDLMTKSDNVSLLFDLGQPVDILTLMESFSQATDYDFFASLPEN